jgi:hypothetical protein
LGCDRFAKVAERPGAEAFSHWPESVLIVTPGGCPAPPGRALEVADVNGQSQDMFPDGLGNMGSLAGLLGFDAADRLLVVRRTVRVSYSPRSMVMTSAVTWTVTMRRAWMRPGRSSARRS